MFGRFTPRLRSLPQPTTQGLTPGILAALLNVCVGVVTPVCGAELAGDFLHVGFGVRSLGLGGSATALARDVEATYWNPACLAYLTNGQMLAMHSEQFAGAVANENLGVALPVGGSHEGGFGVALLRVAVNDIPRTSGLQWLDNGADGLAGTGDVGEDDGEWNQGERVLYDKSRIKYDTDEQLALLLSHGRYLTSRISVGGTAKLIRQRVGDASSFGIGTDLGLAFRPIDNFDIGVRFGDIAGTRLFWDTGRRESVRTSLWVGQAFAIRLGDGASSVTFSTDLRMLDALERESEEQLSGGIEYSYHRILSARVGMRDEGFVGGAGIGYRRLGIDYAFAGHEVLGSTHRVGLTLRLGDHVEAQ